MDNVQHVDVIYRWKKLLNDGSHHFFTVLSPGNHEINDWAAQAVLCDHVVHGFVFVNLEELNDIWMVELTQYFNLSN